MDILYIIFSSKSILQHKNNEAITEKQPSVSVIIAARNEYRNLNLHLKSIVNQEYSDFEVIVVNDKSTDESEALLSEFKNTHQNFNFISIKETPSDFDSKKYALQTGIEKAKNELILLTDADCYPNSTLWISEMVSQLTQDKDIVLGLSPFEIAEPNFIKQFQQYENCITAIQFIFFSKRGMAYMGVGRNLLYRKKIFTDVNGFEGIKSIKGGDDDLLLQKIAKPSNVSVCTSSKSVVYSYPKEKVKDYWLQKLRHYGVGRYYKPQLSLSLTLIDLNRSLFYLTFLTLLISGNYFYSLSLFLLRMAMFLLFYILVISKLRVYTSNITALLTFDSLHILQRNLVGFLSFIFNPKKW